MNIIGQWMAQTLGVGVPLRTYGILAQATRPAPSPAAAPRTDGFTDGLTGFLVGIGLGDLARFIPNLIGALLILLLGLLVAWAAAAFTRWLLSKTHIDNRIAAWITGRPEGAEAPKVEEWIASAVYWIVILFTLVAILQTLQLTAVSAPLQNLLSQVFAFLPKIAGAAILLLVAWGLATIVKLLVTRGLQAARLDQRFGQQVEGAPESTRFSLTETIGNTLYWFIFLLFLPSILSTLDLAGTLQPVQQMLNDILSVLPKIFAAVLIGATGWLIAQVVRQVVTNLLVATGTDSLGTRIGLSPARTGQSLSWIIGTVVYVLILIPVAIAALNALDIAAISAPAIAMLYQILNAIPKIFTAALILIIAYVIGRFVADFVTSILTSLGFNNIFNWLGLPSPRATQPRIVVPPASAPVPEATPYTPEEQATVIQTTAPEITTRTPSEIVGIIVLVGVMLFATVAATNVLQFEALTLIVTGIVVIFGRIIAGLVVFAIGLYLANLAFNLITSTGNEQARILGHAARIAIIALVSAMALQQMGIAPDIVNLAFGLLLGAIAVAIAIAFGLGSRDIAAEQVREWLGSFKDKKDKPSRF